MLAPVAHHEAQAQEQERAEENECGRLAIEAVEGVKNGVVEQFPEARLDAVGDLPLSQEVPGQVKPHEEEKTTNVVKEMENVVTLVSDGG